MRQQPSWMLPKRSLRRPEPPSQISPSSQSRLVVHDLQGGVGAGTGGSGYGLSGDFYYQATFTALSGDS